MMKTATDTTFCQTLCERGAGNIRLVFRGTKYCGHTQSYSRKMYGIAF